MNSWIKGVIAAVWLVLGFSIPAHADSHGGLMGAVFSEVERQVIGDFFRNNPQARRAYEDIRERDERDDDRDDDDRHGKGGKHKSKNKEKGGKGLPPGLARRDSLPPGLQRQLEVKGTLPPGIAKRDLPVGLESRLPKPDRGTRRVVIDDDIVLVEETTGVVLDIIRGALGGNR